MYAWFIRTGFEKLCTHLQTQPGRIQPIDSSQLAATGTVAVKNNHNRVRIPDLYRYRQPVAVPVAARRGPVA
ncbi:hypothetical protein L551_1278 [Bordetella pertussis STO1-SEAT-0004]|nr:hypothetical protein L551_1278 [Bordetella pertussis STO1-SEAT-0004]